MDKIVYVPQGRSAVLSTESLSKGFMGLFTDGFSTCCILVIIGNKAIVLAHIDAQMYPDEIQSDLEAAGNNGEALLLYRPEGAFNAARIDELFTEFPQFNYQQQEVPSFLSGKYIFLVKDEYSCADKPPYHCYQIDYDNNQRPENLVHHPEEDAYVRLRKIQQIIGLQEKIGRRYLSYTPHYLFNIDGWTNFYSDELKLDTSNPLTQKEFACFHKDMLPDEIQEELVKILKNSFYTGIPIDDDIGELAGAVVPYLQSYLIEHAVEPKKQYLIATVSDKPHSLLASDKLKLKRGIDDQSMHDNNCSDEKNIKKQRLR